jgi:hypothetical protein
MKRAKEQRAKNSSPLALLPFSFSLALDLIHPLSFIPHPFLFFFPLWLYAPRQVRDLAEELPNWATDTAPSILLLSSHLWTTGCLHRALSKVASLFLEAIARRRCLSGATIRRSHLHPV